MTRSRRISRVMNVAESHAEAASRGLAEAQGILEQRKRQLAELVAYRDEYVRAHPGSESELDAPRLEDYRSFLSRLTQAIREQEKLVGEAARETDLRRSRWRQRHTRARALENAVDRYRAEEERAAVCREQAELDEEVAYKHRRRR